MIHRARLKEAVHHRRAPCAHEVLEEQGCLPALHQRLEPALTRVVVYRHHRDLQIRHQLLSPFQQIARRSRYRASLRMPVIFGCRPRHEGRPYRLLQPHPDVLFALSGQPLSLDIPLNHVQQRVEPQSDPRRQRVLRFRLLELPTGMSITCALRYPVLLQPFAQARITVLLERLRIVTPGLTAAISGEAFAVFGLSLISSRTIPLRADIPLRRSTFSLYR